MVYGSLSSGADLKKPCFCHVEYHFFSASAGLNLLAISATIHEIIERANVLKVSLWRMK